MQTVENLSSSSKDGNTVLPGNLSESQNSKKLPVIWRFISRITMKKVTSLFVDVINGQIVNLYVDKYGIEWLAQSKFGYRCLRNET